MSIIHYNKQINLISFFHHSLLALHLTLSSLLTFISSSLWWLLLLFSLSLSQLSFGKWIIFSHLGFSSFLLHNSENLSMWLSNTPYLVAHFGYIFFSTWKGFLFAQGLYSKPTTTLIASPSLVNHMTPSHHHAMVVTKCKRHHQSFDANSRFIVVVGMYLFPLFFLIAQSFSP